MKQRKTALILAAALLAIGIVGAAVAALANDNAPTATSAATPGPLIAQVTAETEDESNEAPDEDAAEGPDQPITGPDLERASAAALEYLGEGKVTETEIEDEESYYEVEVTLPDGRQVDVQLDEAFNVVGTD